MHRIENLKRKIKSAEDLLSIVKTMKVLAAVNIRQYEAAAEAIGKYYHTIETGFQILLKDIPSLAPLWKKKRGGKLAVIVIGSGQPLCGQFNESLVAYVAERLEAGLEEAPSKVIAMGTRIAGSLEQKGIAVHHIFEVPVSVGTINERVGELVLEIERWYATDDYHTVVLFNNRPVTQSSFIPVRHQVLPMDRPWLESLQNTPWTGRSRPAYTMETEALLSMLIRQYIFVSIYKFYAESLSSEHGSRLEAMLIAESRISKQLTELEYKYREKRQTEITEEIIDITTGFEVLSSEEEQGT